MQRESRENYGNYFYLAVFYQTCETKKYDFSVSSLPFVCLILT